MVMRWARLGVMMVSCVLVAACQVDDDALTSTPPPPQAAQVAAAQTQVPAPPPPRKPVSVPKLFDLPKLVDRQLVRSNVSGSPKTLTVEASEVPAEPTRILNRASAERLFGNSGLTLQWIGWEERGKVWVAVDEQGVWWLSGEHANAENAGLKLEGYVSEIGADYFLFNGEITIIGTPNRDRMCDANKQWRFGITQNRKYWRLREFEWCDRSTDYVDIYF